MTRNLVLRALLLSGCVMGCALLLSHVTRSESVPLRAPLSQFPMRLTEWQGNRVADLDANVLNQLKVTEYLNRVYRVESGVPVGLYIGYYDTQSQGETMHSPLNCLPGSGWQPVRSGRMRLPLQAGEIAPTGLPLTAPSSIEINRYLVQKSGDSLLVLYWYQSHGRVVASEYWGKIYTVLDALRLNRTDAALVRVVIPVVNPTPAPDPGAEARAEALGINFVHTMFPVLVRYLPV